jgi:type IV pilus assembly protein PilV
MVPKGYVPMNARLLRVTTRASGSWHDGFTLIESMVAAVILTIGLLALTGMQSFSLRKNVDANNQTRVTNLTADMLERVQFNRTKAANYHNINVSSGTTTCPTSAVDVMANGDCTQWRTLLLNSNLQNIVGTVTVSNPTPPAVDPLGLNRYTVTVRVTWSEAASGEVVAASKAVSVVTVVTTQ